MTTTPPVTLVKVGGSIQDNPAQMRAIAADVAALARAGTPVAVVHGGGKAISAAMAAAGLQARFVLGQRYTDQPTLDIAQRVLGGEINTQLVQDVAAAGAFALPVSTLTRTVLHAQRAGAIDAAGTEHDLGLVGRVTDVDTDALARVVAAGIVPVIAPIALDRDTPGGRLNVNADLAAGQIAASWPAVGTFILVSDTPGVRTDATTWAASLSRAQCDALRASNVIDGGMIPKIDACLMALATGPHRTVVITDGRQPGALRAAATAAGHFPGTRITP